MRRPWYSIGLTLCLALLHGCIDDRAEADRFACATDRDCLSGWFCVLGACSSSPPSADAAQPDVALMDAAAPIDAAPLDDAAPAEDAAPIEDADPPPVDAMPVSDAARPVDGAPGPDRDDDTVRDDLDNCPDTPNPDQRDDNDDGVGDACDPDEDRRRTRSDNCPDVFNPVQADRDGDGVGDRCGPCARDLECVFFINDGPMCEAGAVCGAAAVGFAQHGACVQGNCVAGEDLFVEETRLICEDARCVPGRGCVLDDDCLADLDADGIADGDDNCPETYNPLQLDSARVGVGDACRCGGENGASCAVVRSARCASNACGGWLSVDVWEGICQDGRCLANGFEETVLRQCAGIERCAADGSARCALDDACVGAGIALVDRDRDGVPEVNRPGAPVDACPGEYDQDGTPSCGAPCAAADECERSGRARRCEFPGRGVACGNRVVERSPAMCAAAMCAYDDVFVSCAGGQTCTIGPAGPGCTVAAACAAGPVCTPQTDGLPCPALDEGRAAHGRCVDGRCRAWQSEQLDNNEAGPRYRVDTPLEADPRADGFVDKRTGLQWSQYQPRLPLTEAHQGCAARGAGWRLPSIYEVATLLPRAAEDEATLEALLGARPETLLSRTVSSAEVVIGMTFDEHRLTNIRRDQAVDALCVRELAPRIKDLATRRIAFEADPARDPWTGRRWIHAGRGTYDEGQVRCAQVGARLPRPQDLLGTQTWTGGASASWLYFQAGVFGDPGGARVWTDRARLDNAFVLQINVGGFIDVPRGAAQTVWCMIEP